MHSFRTNTTGQLCGAFAGPAARPSFPQLTAENLKPTFPPKKKPLLKKFVRSVSSYVFSKRTALLFENEDTQYVQSILHDTNATVQLYHGRSGAPEKVAALVEPQPGEMLCVIYIGNHIAGYIRAAFQDVYSQTTKSYVHVPAGQVYLHGQHITPDYRGIGLVPILFIAAAQKLHTLGFEKVFLGARSDNAYMLRHIKSTGFRLFKSVTNYRLLGFLLYEDTYTFSETNASTSSLLYH